MDLDSNIRFLLLCVAIGSVLWIMLSVLKSYIEKAIRSSISSIENDLTEIIKILRDIRDK